MLRIEDTKAVECVLQAKKFICLSIAPTYAYENGTRTTTQNGYKVDCYLPDFECVASVKVPAITEEVKLMKRVTFENLKVNVYAPKAWDVRYSLKADKVQGATV